ncbi:PaaI family thioesterase [Sphingomonas sp. Leaf242]|uniref:PaaI family thioesterase n=1 Tax=Sphingomonas sp. Leaf242 TaxID=1736304 RepID=UPI000713A501|nr:PaaI family thioesterase [Sphingomonas sp. Leaf242]KQO05987.1 thioesterase [Sphingomonas sp. Leaf242]
MNFLTDDVELDGHDQMAALMAADVQPPIGETLEYILVELERGRVVFEGSPSRKVYNPIGSVHGGYTATLLDSACSAAVHSSLPAGQGAMTLELKVSYHRALTEASGPVRAEGKIVSLGRRAGFSEARLLDAQGRLCASATSTMMIFPTAASAA